LFFCLNLHSTLAGRVSDKKTVRASGAARMIDGYMRPKGIKKKQELNSSVTSCD
jgi:hypothetical protein